MAENGELPTDEEVAKRMNLTMQQIKLIKTAKFRQPLSLNE